MLFRLARKGAPEEVEDAKLGEPRKVRNESLATTKEEALSLPVPPQRPRAASSDSRAARSAVTLEPEGARTPVSMIGASIASNFANGLASGIGAAWKAKATGGPPMDVWEFLDEEDCFKNTSFDLEALGDGNEVSPDSFEQPCHAISVSGGTAAFFHVRMKAGVRTDVPLDYFIGKDLSHAIDEFEFYSKLRQAIPVEQYWASFGKCAMECPGVAKMLCSLRDKEPNTRALLLLENLRVGYQKLRLLDVKLGAETSIAGWKGKSHLASWRNGVVDKWTNSTVEGFRLEGMELPPRHLAERMLLAVEARNLVSEKATKRFMMQRLRASEFLSAWATVDNTTLINPCTESSFSMSTRSSDASISSLAVKEPSFVPAEAHAHAAIWSAVQAVAKVRRAVTGVPVPQTWIGSSLALGLEVSELTREPLVTAKVFDWGRSDFTLAQEYKQKTDEEKKAQILHWRQYLSAVIRFQFELCRLAEHRCCCPVWTALVCELFKEDFNLTKAMLMGDSKADHSISAGMYELPCVTTPASRRRVRLPLLPRGSQTPCASLHMQVTTRRLPGGESSVHVEVRSLTNILLTNAADGEVVKATIIAFERVADAKLYLKAFHAGDARPAPTGRAYVRETAPTKIADGIASWMDSLEWIGLGERAAEVHGRLAEHLPPARLPTLPRDSVMVRCHPHPLTPVNNEQSQCNAWHCDDPCKDCGRKTSNHVLRYTCAICCYDQCQTCVRYWSQANPGLSYPELLPPTIGSSRRVDMAARAFLAYTAPWAQESAPVPPHWH